MSEVSKISKIKLGLFYYEYHGRQSESNWSVLPLGGAGEGVDCYYSSFYMKKEEGRKSSMFYTTQPKEHYTVLNICRV